MEDTNKNNQDFKGEGNFGLPEDYFEKSAQSIFNKIEWEEEHKAYPQLLNVRGSNGFLVPENYFLNSESKLELIEFPNLKELVGRSGFSTPENYFETKEFETFEKLKTEEQGELSSFQNLSSLPKQNSFSVPQAYFVSGETNIKGLLENNSGTKVISLFRRSVAYSIAAMLLVVISLWVYNYYFKPVEVKDCGTMACVDRMDLVKTKNLEVLDNDELYELVNPAELEKNLGSEENKKAPLIKTDSGLKNIPTEELMDEI